MLKRGILYELHKTVQAISGRLSFICIQMFITPNAGQGIQKK